MQLVTRLEPQSDNLVTCLLADDETEIKPTIGRLKSLEVDVPATVPYTPESDRLVRLMHEIITALDCTCLPEAKL